MGTKTEVAKKDAKGTEVASMSLKDKMAAAAQKHQQAMSQDDMSIPFLQILQALSPQCTRGEPEFIKGAEPSMLFNTVSKQTWQTRDDDNNQVVGMKVIPIHYKRSFIEWIPRKKGGGFVNEWDVAQGAQATTFRNDDNLDIIQEGSPVGTPGNQLNDTHTHFVFVVEEDGSFKPAVITMTSTQLKPSKDWNAMISEVIGDELPRYATVWDVTTNQRSNDQGSWFVWAFKPAGTIEDLPNAEKIFDKAYEFCEGVMAGEHQAEHAKVAEKGEANPSTNEGGDDEVPF